MKLFKFEQYRLQVEPEIWGLKPFSKILKRDNSKNKELAFKEMLFIYYFCDIKSEYQNIPDDNERYQEIKQDIDLPEDWIIDNIIKEAIEFYKKRSYTINDLLYQSAYKSAVDIANYLKNTEVLLAERDKNDKPIYDISKITTSLGKIPKIMEDLKKAYKELVKEKTDTDSKSKGSQTFNMYEDGLKFE